MKADRIASVIFILIALLFWFQTGSMQYNCSIFPRMLAAFLILLSVTMFAYTFTAKAKKSETAMPEGLAYILISIALVFAWIYLLDITGFIVSSVFFLTFLTMLLDLQRPTISRIISSVLIYIVTVSTFWLIFHKFLLVPLPAGYLI